MTAERGRRSKLDHTVESGARGLVDDPEILGAPNDETRTLTETGTAWLGPDHPDDEHEPADVAASRP